MANKKEVMIATSVERKTWEYTKGITKLNFALRTDIKQEMKDFLELLERAVADLKKQLAETKV